MKHKLRFILLLPLLMPIYILAQSEPQVTKTTNSSSSILVICAYNPGASRLEQNIQPMVQEYRAGGGAAQIILEDMGCRGFSEAHMWKKRMADILHRYNSVDRQPQSIVVLGQEAWAAYLAQDSLPWSNVPVLAGMATSNYIDLPTKEQNASLWYPDSKEIADNTYKSKIGGIFTAYDVEKNIELILKHYPTLKHLLLITDNTYGGVSLQSLVRQKMAAYPHLKLVLLDGRVHDIYSISATLKQAPQSSVILLGTWRVDKYESYLVDKTLYTMQKTVPNTPTFTLSSIGLGYWAIGGYLPNYRKMGSDLALQLLSLEKEKTAQATIHILSSDYAFDINKLEQFKIDKSLLPEHYTEINKAPTFWEQYSRLVIFTLALFFLVVLVISKLIGMLRHAKRLTKALSLSESEKSLILGNIPSGLLFLDSSYHVIWKNSVCDQFTPKSCGFRLNEPCYIAQRNRKPCEMCAVRRAVEQKTVVTDEIYHSKRVVNQTVIPVWEDDTHQRLKGVLVRLFDITKDKEAQQALIEAKEQAIESNKLKAAFLANMSHEIRTPLNAIVGFSSLIVELIKEKGFEDEDMLTYSQLINQNSDTLLRLINDILDLSRLETDQLKMHKKQIDIVELCHHCVSTVKASAKPNLIFNIEMPVDSFMIDSDLLRLQQVLINLLTNANKFTDEGTITIHLDIDTPEQMITIYIQDTGIGIAPDKKQKVFRRFEKLNEFAQGTGLGLSISEQIVTRLGGRIWVDEAYDTGAKFIFTHPFNAAIVDIDD